MGTRLHSATGRWCDPGVELELVAESHSPANACRRWVEGGGRLIVDDSVIVDLEEFETWTGIHQHEKENVEEQTDDDAETTTTNEDAEEDLEETPVEEPSSSEARSLTARLFEADCHPLTEDGSSRKLDVCDVNRTQSLSSERKVLWALAR